MNKLIAIWGKLGESLWFIPGLMIVSATVIALVLVDVDQRYGREPLLKYSLVFGLGADGSRGMLTAIATSMLTVATLAFSLTLNALAQVSNQYTPRIIRTFLRDRANQFILGYFVSVFVYCLVVLRTIRGGDEGSFVPSIAIISGLVLAWGGVLVLIFFIHHMARSIQVSTIIQKIVEDGREAVDRIFPEEMGEPADEEKLPLDEMDDADWTNVPSRSCGYVQMVDSERLLEIARERKSVIKIEGRPGEFLGTSAPIASVTGKEGKKLEAEPELIDEINECFIIGPYRTITQDAEFGIRQLVDIALKALSPGVNDTTTALASINNIGEILGRLANRKWPERIRSENGRPLVITKVQSFEDYLSEGFDQIMVSAKGHFAVFERLAAAVFFISTRTSDEVRLGALSAKLKQIDDFAEEASESAFELERVKREFREMRAKFADRRYHVEQIGEGG